ncbi:MAG: DUF1592 domain-containing protein [Verrucomicrobiota bacterium]
MISNLLSIPTTLALLLWAVVTSASAAEETFKSKVLPFFEANCIDCHGPKKSKGKVTLHTLTSEISGEENLELWQSILDMVESGEMPPDDEPQPSDEERAAVVKWIESALHLQTEKVDETHTPPIARRLTNVEYENTMRDLLGIDLKLISGLPNDPVIPYKFNNTAHLMQIGPEQIDRYLETARRAMASVIVDPITPTVHKSRQEWLNRGLDKGIGSDEVGVFGNSRGTAAQGMGLTSFPTTGEFRIRFQASAILPKGELETTLRVMMGHSHTSNSNNRPLEVVGSVDLKNNPDQPQIFEFRGRIENYPPRPGLLKDGKQLPNEMAILPQVIFNNGRLNDRIHNLSLPRAVINWMEFEAPIMDVWPPAHHTRIFCESPLRTSDPKAYVSAVLERFITRAYRRPATTQDVARFTKIYEMIAPDMDTMEAAMRETLSMVLITPDFLYHTAATDGVSHHYELASRLSYFLCGSMPDEELLQLAAQGKLDDADVIAKQARRLLADKRSQNFVRSFTMQWLSLEKMKTVPINLDLFPRFLYTIPEGETKGKEVGNLPTIRDYMIEETVGFIGELIRRNASVLNVVDSDFAYLNEPLAAHYGIPGVQGMELRPVPIKPEQRLGGLLTHGSILVGNGTGSAPHPIYRAVWLREAILGDEVKPPPADVPALTDTAGESAEHASSIKDLLRLHRTQESCNDCHFRLDPWGIPFEHYNAIGKYQPTAPKTGIRIQGFDRKVHIDAKGYQDYLNTIYTVKVEADARLPNGPEVNGMDELKKYLIGSRKQDIAQNMVQRLLTYGLGRELTVRDRAEVDKLQSHSCKPGMGLQDIIVAVCQSPLMRKTH